MNTKKRERITNSERKEAYKEASKFVLDLAKLFFAGIIIGGIMDLSVNRFMLLFCGSLIVIILSCAGAYLYYRALKKVLAYGVYVFLGILGVRGTLHHSMVHL